MAVVLSPFPTWNVLNYCYLHIQISLSGTKWLSFALFIVLSEVELGIFVDNTSATEDVMYISVNTPTKQR